MKRKYYVILLLFTLSISILLSSCGGALSDPSAITTAVTAKASLSSATPPSPAVLLSLEAVINPITDPNRIADPSAEINKCLIDLHHPTEADFLLYNDMFRAVMEHQDIFDLSGYDMPFTEKVMVGEMLYGESSFRLSQLQFVRFSEEDDEARFIYYSYDDKEFALRQETLSARLGQLLYNVVPDDASDLTKYAALYQYLCETTNYSPDMADPLLMGPDSILVNRVGICWGFSQLLNFILPHIGLEGDYVANTTHAWNQVIIDGERYYTDVTFGTGQYESLTNSFETFLMDDTEREDTLAAAGIDDEDVVLGYFSNDPAAPPSCASDRFAVYGQIHDNYALDIQNDRIFVFDSGGIKRMKLDCSNLITVKKSNVISAVCYNGSLYFLSLYDGFLYRLTEDGTAELLDGDEPYNVLRMDGASLMYAVSSDDPNVHRIPLAPTQEMIEAGGSIALLPTTEMPRSDSFYFVAEFSSPMDLSADWSQLVVMTDEEGNPLATRLTWNTDGTTLTVRPMYSVDAYANVSLYVLTGSPTAEGGLLPGSTCLPVQIHSIAGEDSVTQ